MKIYYIILCKDIKSKHIKSKDISTHVCRDMSSGMIQDAVVTSEAHVPFKKSGYTESDRKYYLAHKERCLEISRPHKMAYWLAHKEELKAKRRAYYETVEKPKRLAKRLIHEPI
jgi:hypothetical protein